MKIFGFKNNYLLRVVLLLVLLLCLPDIMAEPVASESDKAAQVPAQAQEKQTRPGTTDTKSFSFLMAERSKKEADSSYSGSHSGSHSGQALNVSLGLLFILLLIFSMAWFMRKMGYSNISGHEHLKILATLNLGQKEKIVLLQVGKQEQKQQLVLGITASQINTLHVLKEPIEADTGSMKIEQGFAAKLTESLGNFKKVK